MRLYPTGNPFRWLVRWVGEYKSDFMVYLAPHRSYWRIHVVFAILISVATLPYALMPWVVKYYWDRALGMRSVESLMLAVLGLAAIQGLSVVVPLCEGMSLPFIGLRALKKLRLRTFGSVLRIPQRHFYDYTAGDLMQRMLTDTELVRQYGGQQLSGPLSGLIQLAIILPTALALRWELALAQIPFSLAGYILQRRQQRRVAALNSLKFMAHGKLNTIVYEHIVNHYIFDSGLRCGRSRREFADISRRDTDLTAAQTVAGTVNRLRLVLIDFVARVLQWSLAGLLFLTGRATVGELVAFQTVMPTLMANLDRIIAPFLGQRAAKPSAERLQHVLVTGSPEASAKIQKSTFREMIRFDNVAYGYAPERRIVESLSLTIPKGSTLRLVGPNGCGKSTVLKLLIGHFEPHAGRVTIDDVDASRLSLRSRRLLVANAPQEVCLLSGTIRRNIEMCGDMNSREFAELAKALELDRFMRSLPEGWNTVLGERGIGLSGGQQKLLVVLRALMSPAPIIVLDEPSTSIDQRMQEKLEKCLWERVEQGKTVIVTTHVSSFMAQSPTLAWELKDVDFMEPTISRYAVSLEA